MWDVGRWETLSRHKINCGRERRSQHPTEARATDLTPGGEEALTSIPKKKTAVVYLLVPSASAQLITKRKKVQSPRQRGERWRENTSSLVPHTNLEFCPEIRTGQVWGIRGGNRRVPEA